MYEKPITTVDDVKEFFRYLVEEESINFHPDTDFGEYVSMESGLPTFDQPDTEAYNNLMEIAFDICHKNKVDIYDIAYNIFQENGLI